MDIGIRLILWLLSSEEEEVVDEFLHLLQTQVSYTLEVEPPNDRYVNYPKTIVIPGTSFIITLLLKK